MISVHFAVHLLLIANICLSILLGCMAPKTALNGIHHDNNIEYCASPAVIAPALTDLLGAHPIPPLKLQVEVSRER